MTKKTLQDWYYSDNINYSERERLNKTGVSDYDYHCLVDLQQILRCENWAKNSSEIRDNIDGRIRKIVFFTPNFNDSKPDASNYSCAIVTDKNDDDWVIVFRPSYSGEIGSDILVKKVTGETEIGVTVEKNYANVSEAERELNGDYPVVAVAPVRSLLNYSDCMSRPYAYRKDLPSNAKYNPDKYILPLDIVTRKMNDRLLHYAIYLGNEWAAELPGLESTKFITWHEFCNTDSSSGFSSGGSNGIISLIHPQIPFKRKEEIIRHIAKAISHGYGGCGCHLYNFATNNCEHFVNSCVLGINNSLQGAPFGVGGLGAPLPSFLTILKPLLKIAPLPQGYFHWRTK